MQPEDQRQHLSFLQALIARQAGNQFLIKGWSLTVAAAMYAYAASKERPAVAVVGAAISVVFAALDGYYLRQERLFRKVWCAAVAGDLAGYTLDSTPYGNPLPWPWHLPPGDTRRFIVALSPPLVLLYGTQVLFGMVLALVV